MPKLCTSFEKNAFPCSHLQFATFTLCKLSTDHAIHRSKIIAQWPNTYYCILCFFPACPWQAIAKSIFTLFCSSDTYTLQTYHGNLLNSRMVMLFWVAVGLSIRCIYTYNSVYMYVDVCVVVQCRSRRHRVYTPYPFLPEVDERLCMKPDGSDLLGCHPSYDGELWACYATWWRSTWAISLGFSLWKSMENP